MSDTPGLLSKILVILGITSFLFADLFGFTIIEILLDEPERFEEGLGNIIGTIIALLYGLLFAFVGSILVLLGQIWKQTKLLVLPSLLAFGFFLVPLGWLTLSSNSINPGLLGIWVYAILVLLAHFRGLTRS